MSSDEVYGCCIGESPFISHFDIGPVSRPVSDLDMTGMGPVYRPVTELDLTGIGQVSLPVTELDTTGIGPIFEFLRSGLCWELDSPELNLKLPDDLPVLE